MSRPESSAASPLELAPALGTSRPLVRVLARESLLVSIVALSATIMLAKLPTLLGQDTWLSLAAGREVIDHGLPATDRLAYWTHGATWVDQQWLAHVVLYALAAAGGTKLVLLSHVALVTFSLGLAIFAARRLGGTARSVSLTAAVAIAPIVVGASHARAESLAFPLFVALYWLLAADARRPSRRVLLVLPLLVLWASVHGSVLLGALLVCLRGAICGLDGRLEPSARRRGVALALAPLLAFVSPYGPSLVGYYHDVLLNPALAGMVTEWQPTILMLPTIPVYLLAFGCVWLLARHGRSVSGFEQAALGLMLVASFLALRHMPWFALAALMTLPLPLARALPERGSEEGQEGPRSAIAVALVGMVLVLVGVVVHRPTSWLEQQFPTRAASAVSQAASVDPSLRIYADLRYADWLLWRDPKLAGRVAFDARLELLSSAQLERIFRWQSEIGPSWRAAARGARLLVLPLPDSRDTVGTLRADGARQLYRDRGVAVLLRP